MKFAIVALFGSGLLSQTAFPFTGEGASREARFADPPADCRILPIHNVRPADRAATDKETADLLAGGFGGLVCNVSTKRYLEDPEAWELLRRTIGNLKVAGLKCWLYDEKGYPSGSAGNKVLSGHPEWQARAYLVGTTVRDAYIHEGTPADSGISNHTPYPNLLMREPTARFLELTHARYRRELGPLLADVTSFFTDEPALMTYWERPMAYRGLPISDGLLSTYRARYGHELKDDIPYLMGGEPTGICAEVRCRYWSLVGELVSANFTGQISDWAKRQGLFSGGHLFSEEDFASHVCLYGDFFKVLRGMTAPGCDMLTSIPSAVSWSTPLLAGSAGELNGAKNVMSESSDYEQRHRKGGVYRVGAREIVGSLNRQIWSGVNTLMSYYFWLGLSNEDLRAINLEVGRTLTLAREGHAMTDVVLLYPSHALMTGFEPAFRHGGGAGARRMALAVETAGRSLFASGRPFMFVDADTLADSVVESGWLKRGNLAWRVVVLPHAVTLPLQAAERLAEFVRSGGRVVVVGDRPVNSTEAFPDARMDGLCRDFTVLPEGQGGLLGDYLESVAPCVLSVTRGKRNRLRFTHRRTDAGDVFFVANDSNEPWQGTVRLAADPKVRVWDPRTGTSAEATGEVRLDLPASAAVVLTTDVPVEVPRARGGWTLPVVESTRVAGTGAAWGCGETTSGAARSTETGMMQVDVSLLKDDADSWAFYKTNYAASPFGPADKGVAFDLEVLRTLADAPVAGVFLETTNGLSWFFSSDSSLGRIGKRTVYCPFPQFLIIGLTAKEPPPLDPSSVRAIRIGFGGFRGRSGAQLSYRLSEPKRYGGEGVARKKVPFIYCSDIFHPAMDPDDHFDLAAVFAFDEFDIKALVLDGHIDRKGQDQFNGGGRIPLSQMCRITGRSVPAAVGLNVKLDDSLDTLPNGDPRYLAGVELMRRVLEESDEPVAVKISTGTDLAVLFNRAPELCRKKIKAVYFNAGHGCGGVTDEYNVLLDPVAFTRIFETGLPIYWNPCFGTGRVAGDGHCNFFILPDQRVVLEKAPIELSRFISYVLLKETSDPIAWLTDGAAAEVPAKERWMWTPPVLAHAAGRSVYRLPDGDCVWSRPECAPRDARPCTFYVYDFARVTVDPARRREGVLSVDYGSSEPNVKVFRQLPGYSPAMGSCLRNLYGELGKRP